MIDCEINNLEKISRKLSELINLNHLFLSDNNIQDVGLKPLYDALLNVPKLMYLDISNNCFSISVISEFRDKYSSLPSSI